MKKAILLAGLLVATFSLISGWQSAASQASRSTSPATPIIVASAKLSGQAAPIPVTTIFTAPADGLYMLSAYPSITTADPGSRSQWEFNIFWTDLGAPFSFAPFSSANDGKAGIFENTPNPIALQLKGGTSLTYSVTQAGSPDSSVYSLYYTLERIE